MTTSETTPDSATVEVPDIVHSTKIRTDPHAVFLLLSSGPGWDKWFTHGSTFEPRVGSPVHLLWRGWTDDGTDMTDEGEVVECVPDERFALTWGQPPSRVTFTLTRHPDGTWAEVRETGIPKTSSGLQRFAECSVGWGEALTLLRCYAEHEIRLST